MSIVEFDRSPSWCLDVSKTGESTKCPWVGVVEETAGQKYRKTVTASLFLVFKGCSWILAPLLIKSINKNLSNHRNMISIMCCCAVVNFETFLRSSREHCSRNQFNAVTKLSWMNAGWKNSTLTPKKVSKPTSLDACRLLGVNFEISVGDFSGKNKYILNLFEIPERAGIDKIRLADLWKYIFGLKWIHKKRKVLFPCLCKLCVKEMQVPWSSLSG